METYEFRKKLESIMENSFDRAIEQILDIDPLPIVDFETPLGYQNQYEKDAVQILSQSAKQLGGTDVSYSEGVFYVWFNSKQAVEDFCEYLDSNMSVDDYDVDVVTQYELGADEVSFDEVEDSDEVGFEVFAHLDPSIVSYMPVEIEEKFDDENGKIFEVRRVVKINARGKRRIKMQCNPGYKWNAARHVCQRITGVELARHRLAARKAVRTKKAKGITYRARIIRRAKRARKFRTSFGLR